MGLLLLVAAAFLGDSYMVDNIDSPPERSLADSEAFKEARELLPGGRVMFMFLEVAEAVDRLEEVIDPYGDLESTFDEAVRSIPEYLAASASFIDGGIRFDLAGGPPRWRLRPRRTRPPQVAGGDAGGHGRPTCRSWHRRSVAGDS